jgi:uncharacterized protein YbaR (Trm112 family)
MKSDLLPILSCPNCGSPLQFAQREHRVEAFMNMVLAHLDMDSHIETLTTWLIGLHTATKETSGSAESWCEREDGFQAAEKSDASYR